MQQMFKESQIKQNSSIMQQDQPPISVQDLKKSQRYRFVLRQKSEKFFTLGVFEDFQNLNNFLKHQKLQSDFELLEIKDVILSLIVKTIESSARKSSDSPDNTIIESEQPTYSFFQIMLNSLSSLINNFLKIEAKEISDQNFDLMRRVIGSFENLKNNYNKSIETNAFVLSPTEKGFMTKFFTSIEFLLRRFGKIISMFQVIFQRYTFESQKLSNRKSFQNSFQKKLTEGISDSKSISNWAKKSSNSSISKYTMFSSKETSGGRNDTGQILSTLSKDQKESIVIQHILKQQTSFWSNQLEQERAQSVPLIVCRICSQKIYADQQKKHTDLCNLKFKVKGQRKDKLKTEKAFLDISSKATEAILYLQKLSVNKSPMNTMMSTTFQFNRSGRQGSESMKQDRPMFEAQLNPLSTTLAMHTFYDTTSVDTNQGLPQKQEIATSNPLLKVSPLLNTKLRQFDEVNNIKRMGKDEVQNLYQSSESTIETPLDIKDKNYQTVVQKAPREEIKSNAQLIEEECKVGKKEVQMFDTLDKVSVGLSKEKKVSRLSLLKSKGIKGVKTHGKVIKPDSGKKLNESQLESQQEEKQTTAPTVNLLSGKIQPPTQKLESFSQLPLTEFSPIQIPVKKVLSQFAAIKQPLEEATNPPVQNQIQKQYMMTNQTIKSSHTLTPTTGLNFLQEFQKNLDKSAGENSSDKKSQMAMIKRVSKQEVELLEHWKTMAQNSYYASIDSDSLQQNIMVQRLIKLQLENVSQMVSLPQLCEKSVKVGTDYINVLELKLNQLKEGIEIDKRLQSTVPKVPTKLDDEILADKKIKDAINHVLKGPDKQTFENAIYRQSHAKGLTIKDLKGFLAKQNTQSQLAESEGKQSQLPSPFAADRRQSIWSNVDLRKSAWSDSTSMAPELLKNRSSMAGSLSSVENLSQISRKQSPCKDQMQIKLEKTTNYVLEKPIKRISSRDLNKNPVFDSDTDQFKVDSMFGLQQKIKQQSLPKCSNEYNIDPARALRKKQINQINQLMKGQKPTQRESQFKRQDGTGYGFPIGKQNIQSDSDASSEEQKGQQVLLNVAESEEESTAKNGAKINKNLLTDQSNIIKKLSGATEQYQTTNYVVQSDIEPSCINYAFRKAPDTDWSKESSDLESKGDILSQSDKDQEIKTRETIEVKRQNLNQTCDQIKGRNQKSPKTPLVQQGEDKKESKKSSAYSYSQKSFREKGFDRLISSKDKALNESGFAKQNAALVEKDFSQRSSQMPFKQIYKSRRISNKNLSTQAIGLGINRVMKEQHTEVFSQSGDSFDLESLKFLSGNEKKQKESDFALGDDKVSLISFSPKLSSFAGLQQTFSQTPTLKLPYGQRKSQFSKPTDAEINQTDMHSSQVQVTSNNVYHNDESNSISYHSRETFLDKKINQNEPEKILTSIFKAPQFMQISIQPKVDSDSEISQGVEMTSSDFEQMKSNQNFGKFNDVNKQSSQFENVSVLLKNSSEVYEASVIDIFENIPQNLAENKTQQGLKINQINKTRKTESNELKKGSQLFAKVNNSKSAQLRGQSEEYNNQKNKPSRFLKENSKETYGNQTRKSNKTEEYFAKSKSGSQICSGHFGKSQEEAKSNSLSNMSMNTSYKEKKQIKIKSPNTFAREQENDESGSDLSFKTALDNFEEDNSPNEQLSPIEQPQTFEAMPLQSSANSISIQSRKLGSQEAVNSATLSEKLELINHKNITMDQVDANLPQTSSNRRKTSHASMDTNYLNQFKKESKTEEVKGSVEKEKEVKGLLPTNLEMPSDLEFQSSSEETSDEVLNFKLVRFNSCVILPSEKACCQLDYQPESQKASDKMSIQDFILLKTVSSGAYGKVILARKKATKDLFAIKVLDKEMMVEKNVADFVMNERDILNKVDNDFIVRGVYTFQSKKYLYMVMEYMKGGDFGNLLENVHALNVETTKFYLAHVVLALEHLHSMGIVHRDLKPENMLIAADGHVKLTDFGLSEAGLRKKIQKTIMSKPKFKSKSEIFSINLDLAEQKLERNEITAKNLEIGLEKKQACVDQDIAQQIGGIEGFLPHKEKELIEKIKPNYQLMMSNNKKTFNRPSMNANINRKKTRSQSCVYDDMNKFQAFIKKEESVQSPSDTPIETKKPRILGTADYMAPEVIKGESVNYLLDFWSLGVIGYEFLTGNLPFNDETPSKIFNNILEKEIEWPPIGQGEGQINPVAKDFLYKLLRRDPKERLGAKEGIKELKRHPFFLGTNWNNLINEPVPWLPQGKDDAVTNFPKAPTANDDVIKEIINEEQESLPSFGKLGGAQPFEQFDGISYASLNKINEREANKAMIWAQRQMKKKSKGERDASVNRFAESDSIVQVPQNMTIKDISAFIPQQQTILNPFEMK